MVETGTRHGGAVPLRVRAERIYDVAECVRFETSPCCSSERRCRGSFLVVPLNCSFIQLQPKNGWTFWTMNWVDRWPSAGMSSIVVACSELLRFSQQVARKDDTEG